MRYQGYQRDSRTEYFAKEPMRPHEERIQPIPSDAQYNWTETNMFGFNIPEHAIDCMVWFVYWPKLGSTYGGVTLWQGIKAHYMEAEVWDFRTALPLPADNTNWNCPNGVSISMIEPLRAFALRYCNAESDVEFDVELRAATPPIVRYGGNHLVQPMKTSGSLRLNGKRYAIDGFYARDRSWREHRNEAPMALPPVSWITGVFGDDLSFHLLGFENSARRPEWKTLYPPFAEGENVLWGFVCDGGRPLGVAQAELYVERPNGLSPMGTSMELVTENGASYTIEGKTIALNPAMGWPNIATNYALTEWRCGGRTGWGDNQDVMYGHHIRHLARARAQA